MLIGSIIGIRSGKATITAKAKENSISNKIDVEVYSAVTDMTVNISEIMLQVGNSFNIIQVIYPEDANNSKVNYYSEDESIASVTANGNIIAISEGTTNIIAETEENKIQRKINVNVIKKIEEEELSFDESLTIYGNEISGWNYKNMKVENIKNNITTIYQIQICDEKGNILKDEELVGTGSKIRILQDEQVIMEYQIVLYGDVNGDGKINSIDLLVLQRHILEIQKLTNSFLTAGNIRKDGKNPSSLDSLLIQRHILELQTIQQ